MTDCDVAVIGAGIVGLATARELLARRPGLRVTILEREDAVGRHQTGHNSGVIHAGIYYAPGSLKARLCVEGARELYEYCEARGVPFQRCGKLIVAVERDELPRLDELERRGRANGVPGLRRIGAAEIAEIEPHAAGVAALHSPATGVVDFGAVARALAADVVEAGAALRLGCEVLGLRADGGGVAIEHAAAHLRARHTIVCAGAWADRLAAAAGAPADPRIVPFRGAYAALRPAHLVRALIYPVPDPALPFLGVHLTRGLDGEVHVGPTALLAGARDAYRLAALRPRDLRDTLAWPGTWRLMRRWWRTGVTELRHAASSRALAASARRYVPAIGPHDLQPAGAGVRAQAVGRDGRLVDDFVVSETPGALHVRNAPSPAATSALALARLIADRCESRLSG